MRRALYKIPVFVVVIAMLMPSVWPLLDHHFAERQPGHLHIGSDRYIEHSHAYQSGGHVHSHPNESSDYPIVFYNYDTGLSASAASFMSDTAMDSFRQYIPTSVFTLPSSVSVLVKNNYSYPPGKPPRPLG